MYSDINPSALPLEGFPIRRSADQGVLSAPRSLSQIIASFFVSWYQGIHRLLLVALPIRNNYFRHSDRSGGISWDLAILQPSSFARMTCFLLRIIGFPTQTYMFVFTYYAIVKVQSFWNLTIRFLLFYSSYLLPTPATPIFWGNLYVITSKFLRQAIFCFRLSALFCG